MRPHDCPNCAESLCGAALFCSRCGQKQDDYQRPFPRLVGDLLGELLDLDGRMWVTLKTLLFRPGELTLEFTRQRRAAYTPPLRLYLVISSVFFLSLVLGGNSDVLAPTLENGGADPDRMQDQYARLAFLMLPTFALLLKLVYPKVPFLTHLLLSLHIQLIGLIALGLMLPFEKLADTHWIGVIAQLVPLIYTMAYLWTAMYRVYAGGVWKTSAKYLLLLLLYMASMGLGLRVIETITRGF